MLAARVRTADSCSCPLLSGCIWVAPEVDQVPALFLYAGQIKPSADFLLLEHRGSTHRVCELLMWRVWGRKGRYQGPEVTFLEQLVPLIVTDKFEGMGLT